MKNIVGAMVLAFCSATASASEYSCHSISKDIQVFLVFDSGPGGLDDAQMKIKGVNYSSVVWDEHSKVVQIISRDTFRKTFEYGSDKVEVGFDAKNGLKLDIFVKRQLGDVFDGTIYVQNKRSQRQASAFTCLQN